MKFDWLVSTAVAVLMLGVSPSFAASNSTKVCDLLTREELMAAESPSQAYFRMTLFHSRRIHCPG